MIQSYHQILMKKEEFSISDSHFDQELCKRQYCQFEHVVFLKNMLRIEHQKNSKKFKKNFDQIFKQFNQKLHKRKVSQQFQIRNQMKWKFNEFKSMIEQTNDMKTKKN